MGAPRLHHELLDRIRSEFKITSDFRLAEFLELSAPTISRIRASKEMLSPAVILTVHEVTGWPVSDIREHMLRQMKNIANREAKNGNVTQNA